MMSNITDREYFVSRSEPSPRPRHGAVRAERRACCPSAPRHSLRDQQRVGEAPRGARGPARHAQRPRHRAHASRGGTRAEPGARHRRARAGDHPRPVRLGQLHANVHAGDGGRRSGDVATEHRLRAVETNAERSPSCRGRRLSRVTRRLGVHRSRPALWRSSIAGSRASASAYSVTWAWKWRREEDSRIPSPPPTRALEPTGPSR